VRHASIDDVTADMLPDASVDAIITDPPYPREFLRLFSSLIAWRKALAEASVEFTAETDEHGSGVRLRDPERKRK
jgi:hypothetical protein